MPPTIAVLGAGPAGAAAARTLAEAGLHATVFDKGRVPGGRCSTRRRPAPGFDHGAQILPTDLSEPVAKLLRGAPLAAWPGSHLRTTPGGTDHRWPSPPLVPTPGMHALIDDLLDHPNRINIACSVRVARIDRLAGSLRLTDDNGNTLGEFDRLILALPAPQAAELLRGTEPDLADTAAAVRVLPCWAAMIRARPISDRHLASITADQHPAVAWIARDSSKPGRDPVEHDHWVLHASTTWSTRHLELEKHEAAELLESTFLDALSELGLSPVLIDTHAHRWRYAFTGTPVGVDHLASDDGSIAVAGDWLLGDRITHAIESGIAAAETLVQELAHAQPTDR
ncbi:MAG: FAD-dependent oxidoreductase [Planctomycetota bacterium]